MSSTEPAGPERPSQAGSVVETATYSGPIPAASELQKYEGVLPGSADRILRMAEDESRHRIDWERTALDAGVADSRRGQYLGFSVCLALVVGAVVCAALNQQVIGAALVGASALGVVTAFVKGHPGSDKN